MITPKGVLVKVDNKVFYTKRHRSGMVGRFLIEHDVYKDVRGWYFARIEHPECKGARAVEWRKISYKDVCDY